LGNKQVFAQAMLKREVMQAQQCVNIVTACLNATSSSRPARFTLADPAFFVVGREPKPIRQ
jgi:hypothetical protein